MTTHAATLILEDNNPGLFVSLTDQLSNSQIVVCDNHPKARKAMSDTLSDDRTAPGLYLLLGDKACYIGQSKNLMSRIGTHTRNKKVGFTRAIVLMHPSLLGTLDYLEAALYVNLKKLGVTLEQRNLEAIYHRERARYTASHLTVHDDLPALFLTYARMFGFVGSARSVTRGSTSVPESTASIPSPSVLPPLVSLTMPATMSSRLAVSASPFATPGLPVALQPVLLQCRVPDEAAWSSTVAAESAQTALYGYAQYDPNDPRNDPNRPRTQRVILLKGSVAIAHANPSGTRVRTSLKNKSKWQPHPQNPKLLVLQEDYSCALSTAAALITGSETNGHIAWKTLQGKTLREVKDLATQARAAQLKTANSGP